MTDEELIKYALGMLINNHAGTQIALMAMAEAGEIDDLRRIVYLYPEIDDWEFDVS